MSTYFKKTGYLSAYYRAQGPKIEAARRDQTGIAMKSQSYMRLGLVGYRSSSWQISMRSPITEECEMSTLPRESVLLESRSRLMTGNNIIYLLGQGGPYEHLNSQSVYLDMFLEEIRYATLFVTDNRDQKLSLLHSMSYTLHDQRCFVRASPFSHQLT